MAQPYIVSVILTRRFTGGSDVQVVTYQGIANNPDEAIGGAVQTAFGLFPNAEGWSIKSAAPYDIAPDIIRFIKTGKE